MKKFRVKILVFLFCLATCFVFFNPLRGQAEAGIIPFGLTSFWVQVLPWYFMPMIELNKYKDRKTTFHNQIPLLGQFKILTYNVAGLPEIFSQSKPSKNMPLIAQDISSYALALVQEDFWYHNNLSQHADFAYKTQPGSSLSLGDGLGQFAKIPLHTSSHIAWKDCHGFLTAYSDCLTAKGFSFSQVELSPGIDVDVYNLHLDAGEDAGDAEARVSQLRQLTAYIQKNSAHHAIIVAGDFNFHLEKKDSPDLAPYLIFLKETGLTDSCYVTHCSEERLDRILYRSNPQVFLSAQTWLVRKDFQDSEGQPLSDHDPVTVDFSYQVNLTPEDIQTSLASYQKE